MLLKYKALLYVLYRQRGGGTDGNRVALSEYGTPAREPEK